MEVVIKFLCVIVGKLCVFVYVLCYGCNMMVEVIIYC